MPIRPTIVPAVVLILLAPVTALYSESFSHTNDAPSARSVASFFSEYCTTCHGENLQSGSLVLHDIDVNEVNADNLEQWKMIDDRLRFHDMPPKQARQPKDSERKVMLAWIRTRLLRLQGPGVPADPKLLLPEFGNYVDHDALFNEAAGPVIPGPARIWRLRPSIYSTEMNRIVSDTELFQPFSLRGKPGLLDYASMYFVDEPVTDLLLRNADLVVEAQSRHPHFGAVYEAMQPGGDPDRELMERAIDYQFELALHRTPTSEEKNRFLKFWEENITSSGHSIGTKATLVAVMMQPEALFRFELGAGEIDESGRQRLSQREIAQSINYALRDEIDATLWSAANNGMLATKDQVATQVQRLLDEPNRNNPRLLEFFREYFDYPRATKIFKDAPKRGSHNADLLINDLESLIQYILEQDQNVLFLLLTTDKAFVNWMFDHKRGKAVQAKDEVGIENVYGLPLDWKWTSQQPITLPGKQRAGVLTHPAWLVAWSGNFDNDPVRRGKWIRTRLLGGSVPAVPIGVDARIPDSEHMSLRDRLNTVTKAPTCWRCHQKMNPLGLPFEQYTHYGYFRTIEKNRPVVTTGLIDRTDDNRIDGSVVDNPITMVHTLAESERVEQVFVRYAFRFYMGRNETLGDAATLQEAWKIYRASGGSYKALVKSLLTSDSFLYRTL